MASREELQNNIRAGRPFHGALSNGSAFSILTEDLGLRKRSSPRVPKALLENRLARRSDLSIELYLIFFSFFLKLKGTFERNWILVLLRSRMWPGIRDIPEGILWWKHRVWVLNEGYLENSLCCFLQVQFIKVLCRPLFYQFVVNPGIKVGQCDMENIDQLLWGNVSITF